MEATRGYCTTIGNGLGSCFSYIGSGLGSVGSCISNSGRTFTACIASLSNTILPCLQKTVSAVIGVFSAIGGYIKSDAARLKYITSGFALGLLITSAVVTCYNRYHKPKDTIQG